MWFEESKMYKKALEEYQKEVFDDILKPKEIIIYNRDTVYLFYQQDKVKDIFKQIIKIYEDTNNDIETNFPTHLWYEKPELKTKSFMGVEYQVVVLWYDHEQPPVEFQN